jgi:hypothetical protein
MQRVCLIFQIDNSANDTGKNTKAANTHLEELEIDAELKDEEEYQIEALVGHKVINKTPYYRIKWAGWPSSANTWEPIGNLGKCQDLIVEFHRPRRGHVRTRKKKRRA